MQSFGFLGIMISRVGSVGFFVQKFLCFPLVMECLNQRDLMKSNRSGNIVMMSAVNRVIIERLR